MSKRITIPDSIIDIRQLEFIFMASVGHALVGRIYHHFSRMEEFSDGMWRSVSSSEKEKYVNLASQLMKNSEEFKNAMRKAVSKWRRSCEANLTDTQQNRIAWLGHAGCCVGVGSPEDLTREAWWTLNRKEQDDANRVAFEVIQEWERNNAKTISWN